MKIEAGKAYYTRDGRVARIVVERPNRESFVFPMAGTVPKFKGNVPECRTQECWTAEGMYLSDTNTECEMDLVAPVPDEPEQSGSPKPDGQPRPSESVRTEFSRFLSENMNRLLDNENELRGIIDAYQVLRTRMVEVEDDD